MEGFDYIIVGAGAAGCVLADRLTANGRDRVLLIEAGGQDKSLLISMPMGFGKLSDQEAFVRKFVTEPTAGNAQIPETWPRGRTLGGSTSINGMHYFRGHPQDFDNWVSRGAHGWGWNEMSRCFRAIEDHALGVSELRGAGGPLHVSPHPRRHPVSEAALAAGVSLGIPRRDDINHLDQEGIGYAMRTIRDGVRVSAASAFLRPAMSRPNLTVLTGTSVEKVLFEGSRAVGVACVEKGGQRREFRAARDVILSAGAIQSAQLLQLSGIGPAEHLRGLGIEVVRDSPGVGANLREHLMEFVQHRLKVPASYNGEFVGIRPVLHLLRYLLTKGGMMSASSHEVWAYVKTREGLERPDAQLAMAPFSLDRRNGRDIVFEREPGMQIMGYQLRPESQGSVLIRSRDPAEQPSIRPAYLTAEEDQHAAIAIVRYMRRLFSQPALREVVAEETLPGPQCQSDDEILELVRLTGNAMHHAAGTCRMGDDPMAVVDGNMRAHGVSGLRVADASIMPTLVSATPAAAVMAMGWRAAELIQADS